VTSQMQRCGLSKKITPHPVPSYQGDWDKSFWRSSAASDGRVGGLVGAWEGVGLEAGSCVDLPLFSAGAGGGLAQPTEVRCAAPR